LARALVVDPDVLLLDEPLSNLDAKLREEMRLEIRGLVKQTGATALYVTHDQAEALSIADRVVIMDKGKVAQIGTPDAVYERPANLFVATFMGSSESVIRTFREMPNPQADILTSKHFMLMQAIEDSRRQHGEPMLVRYQPKDVQRLDARLIDKDGYWFTERWSARAIVYHDAAAKKYGEIRCFKDLLTWKGSFEYADPITQGSGFSATVRRATSVASVQFTEPSCGAIIACICDISADRSGICPAPPTPPGAPPNMPPSPPPKAVNICSNGVPLKGLGWSSPLSDGWSPGSFVMAPSYSPRQRRPRPSRLAR
jgi:hypothetical protein